MEQAQQKEGIEKVYLAPRHETVNNEDGTVTVKEIPQWEVRAKGKKYVKELRGMFKDSAQDMMHQSLKENKAAGGDVKITRPDGSVDTVRADREDMVRRMPGFCVHATRPTFTMDGFGGMKSSGFTRMRIRYHNGQREILEAK